MVTLWSHVDHDPARILDGRAAGAALREIHDLLRDFEAVLPHFARLDEVRAILSRLDPPPAGADDLATMVTLAEERLAAREVPLQPVHGTPGSATCLRTPDGPLWSDFEKVCLGPREFDLACNETAARGRGRVAVDDEFVTGYGPHDAGLLAWVTPLQLVPLTAWTYRLAASRPEYLDAARIRLTWALEGLIEGRSG